MPSPSLTEGPYFVDDDLFRADIRSDPDTGVISAGIPLSLAVNVSQVQNCQTSPLVGAVVDLWHCDAAGVYSDIGAQNSTGKKYLRGYQVANRQGNVYFLTVYPGWYQGRAVHIHVKVRVFSGLAESYEFTSQFFFDDAFSAQIYTEPPYNSKGQPDTRNATDGIYAGASSTGTIRANSGSYLLSTVRRKSGWIEADAELLCDLSLGSSPDQAPGGGEPGGPGGPGGPGSPGGPGGPGGPPPGERP